MDSEQDPSPPLPPAPAPPGKAHRVSASSRGITARFRPFPPCAWTSAHRSPPWKGLPTAPHGRVSHSAWQRVGQARCALGFAPGTCCPPSAPTAVSSPRFFLKRRNRGSQCPSVSPCGLFPSPASQGHGRAGKSQPFWGSPPGQPSPSLSPPLTVPWSRWRNPVTCLPPKSSQSPGHQGPQEELGSCCPTE